MTSLTKSRVILIIFNVIFFAFGLALLGIGIYSKVQSSAVDDYLRVIDRSNNVFENFGSVCIVVGVFCTVLGFTGLWGAIKDSKCCLIFFVSLVVLVFVLEVVAAGLAYGYHSTIEESVRTGMQTTLERYGTNDPLTQSWDSIQQNQQCCGILNYTDWANSNATYNQSLSYPSSCICGTMPRCSDSSTDFGDVFSRGCFTVVDTEVLKNWQVWGGAAIGFAVIELIGIFCGVVAIRQSGKADYRLA